MGCRIGTICKIEAKISEWIARWGKISTLVGHSKGGWYVHNVFLKKEMIRVSFNALNAKEGMGHFALRLPKDPISRKPLSIKKRYCTLKFAGEEGPTGHQLIKFEKALEGKNWCDIRDIKFRYFICPNPVLMHFLVDFKLKITFSCLFCLDQAQTHFPVVTRRQSCVNLNQKRINGMTSCMYATAV